MHPYKLGLPHKNPSRYITENSELESFLNLNTSLKSHINYDLLYFDEDLTDEQKQIGMGNLFNNKIDMQIFEEVTLLISDINKLKIPILISTQFSADRIKGFLAVTLI